MEGRANWPDQRSTKKVCVLQPHLQLRGLKPGPHNNKAKGPLKSLIYCPDW
jgi:hypothetical protein